MGHCHSTGPDRLRQPAQVARADPRAKPSRPLFAFEPPGQAGLFVRAAARACLQAAGRAVHKSEPILVGPLEHFRPKDR